MSLTNLHKTPFPWFGGKTDAAEHVWAALGDVEHYVEPFFGSGAVLMRRPHQANRPYFSETVNDADGLLVNAWRGIQLSPDAVAEAASYPVAEADMHARHLALVRWREERQLEHLMGDPAWHDPVMAGWWLWGCSSWIGSGWCDGTGGWTADSDGRLVKRAKAAGVSRQRPHLGNNGQGVNAQTAREPGVARQLSHLGNDGRGVNHARTREPGIGEVEYHPMAMPELRRWMQFLSARLRHVRILNGDWARCCTDGAALTLSVRQGGGHAGIFLDPPYGTAAGRAKVYSTESFTVADEVRAWCIEAGRDPRKRIVLAGYDVEHAELEAFGWRVVEWFKAGLLKGGMGNTGANGHQQRRERLWLSPACLVAPTKRAPQGGLFDAIQTEEDEDEPEEAG